MKKLYYTIGEVSQITEVEPYILRYWETIFKDLSPSKNQAGKRVYTQKHIQTIFRLKELIHDKKYSTAGAKLALQNKEDSSSKQDHQTEQLPRAVRQDLNEIKQFLNKLLKEL